MTLKSYVIILPDKHTQRSQWRILLVPALIGRGQASAGSLTPDAIDRPVGSKPAPLGRIVTSGPCPGLIRAQKGLLLSCGRLK